MCASARAPVGGRGNERACDTRPRFKSLAHSRMRTQPTSTHTHTEPKKMKWNPERIQTNPPTSASACAGKWLGICDPDPIRVGVRLLRALSVCARARARSCVAYRIEQYTLCCCCICVCQSAVVVAGAHARRQRHPPPPHTRANWR